MDIKNTAGDPDFAVEPIPAFRDNYIWLLRRGDAAALVDPGDAAPAVAALEGAGLRLAAILVTHHHADHQGGIADLVERYRPEVFGPAAESITGLTRPLAGGEVVALPALGAAFRVLAVPGHTRGHLAYAGHGCLFCGDTLFGLGCGRLFEGTPVQMAASLDALAALPDDTRVYAAHEYTQMNLPFALAVDPHNAALASRALDVAARRARGEPTLPSTLGLEKATNPFLRCREPALVAAARSRDAAAADPVAVFAALRAWRNEF